MIDQNDIRVLKHWLHLAKTIGTDAVRIVAGDELYTYKVTVEEICAGCTEKSKGGE